MQIVCHPQVVPLALDEVTSLGMAVAELVTNSYNHAFPDQDGTITVSLAHAGPGYATITVQDDGVGFVAKADSPRHGMGLVGRLLKRIAGTLDMHLDNGTVWTLTFAVPVLADGTKAAA